MTPQTHTPGKWEIVTKGELLYQVGVVQKRGIDLISAVYNCNSEAAANAALIAAAPDLLALAQRFLTFANSEIFNYPPGALNELQRLIDKTTGDAQ